MITEDSHAYSTQNFREKQEFRDYAAIAFLVTSLVPERQALHRAALGMARDTTGRSVEKLSHAERLVVSLIAATDARGRARGWSGQAGRRMRQVQKPARATAMASQLTASRIWNAQ
jgi:hypothetical protein